MPSDQRRPAGAGILSDFVSRTTLFIVNVVGVIFGCICIFFGVTGYVGMGKEKTVGEITNPFALVIGMGVLVLLVSLLGLGGGMCAKSLETASEGSYTRRMATRLLLVYYVLILTICSGLLYAMFLCFLFAEKANDYVESYWGAIELVVGDQDVKQVEEFLQGHSSAGGLVCMACILLNLVCGHCSSVLMGYRYTTRKTMIVSNFMTFVLGLTTTIIAFLPSTSEMGVKNGWLPNAIGSIGVVTLVFSGVGLVGAWRGMPLVLLVHAAVLGLLGIILLGFAIFAMADGKGATAMMRAEWVNIHQNYVDVCPHCTEINPDPLSDAFADCCALRAGLIVWDNMTILGVSGAVLVISLCLNWFGSLYLWRKIRLEQRQDMEMGVVDTLQGGPSDGGRNRAKHYSIADPSDDL
mmetsp:Transcript_13426/g.26505  ORF Transcript_13426/g.26505 Transcript_13426/m.26505 type:complete len:409 (+) Transcript_13426:199-1425(+)|eukprot:CAMPEP_0173383016 /NCGR_PEP_ID=MMETSP1356-20130122/5546_1 /TAXON_ID=77927 ORGANISM="Hemiselmis virescens, Strain PCC157" /NCGR_SAMPLE_ID=MMETSP1356 /ASSEMBLY_ACC=CAM_ASM_000847 /LENGTH=408 /DNA_ID=CAMNT_0014337657 /DNA_START=192 /DNA_END=1418 /DNA_ORIENTATION=-